MGYGSVASDSKGGHHYYPEDTKPYYLIRHAVIGSFEYPNDIFLPFHILHLVKSLTFHTPDSAVRWTASADFVRLGKVHFEQNGRDNMLVGNEMKH